MSEILIRPVEKSDLPFIYNSWLKSYKISLINRYMDDTQYFAYHHDVFEYILNKSTCKCMIAASPSDPQQILGYIVAEHWSAVVLMHWVYVKEAARNVGVARQLEQSVSVEGKPSAYTFFSRYNDKLSRERKYRYFPFYIAISEP